MTFVVLVVFAAFAWYIMNADERERLARALLRVAGQAKGAAAERWKRPDPFEDALRVRTRWVIVTPVLSVASAAVFFQMLLAPGAVGENATLLAWGGNFGPATTNGGWGRLIASLFVHTSVLHFLVNFFALVQLGLLLERLVGSLTFAIVFLASGIVAGVIDLHANPVDVHAGASGAVLGLYGLLLAACIWSRFPPSAVSVPLRTLRAVAPVAAVFLLYGAVGETFQAAEWAGAAVGFVSGMVLTRDMAAGTTPARRLALAGPALLLVAAAAAFPVRGIADVRPELARLVEIEDRTAASYTRAVGQFRLGAISTSQLAGVIERAILPEMDSARARIATLRGVPPQHQPLVQRAEEYLRLRHESWRLRSEALRRSNMPALRAADQREHDSLEALNPIRTSRSTDDPMIR